MYTAVASNVFKHSISRLRAFLSKKYDDEFAGNQIESIRNDIQNKLCTNPYIAPVSERLLALGMSEYRQWCVDEHNILYFRIREESSQIELLAVMDARQNIQKLLFEIMVLE